MSFHKLADDAIPDFLAEAFEDLILHGVKGWPKIRMSRRGTRTAMSEFDEMSVRDLQAIHADDHRRLVMLSACGEDRIAKVPTRGSVFPRRRLGADRRQGPSAVAHLDRTRQEALL
jgi:hypothetical protein